MYMSCMSGPDIAFEYFNSHVKNLHICCMLIMRRAKVMQTVLATPPPFVVEEETIARKEQPTELPECGSPAGSKEKKQSRCGWLKLGSTLLQNESGDAGGNGARIALSPIHPK